MSSGALLPGVFYMFVVSCYILNAGIGFRLPWSLSYSLAAVLTLAYGYIVVRCGKKQISA